MKTILFIEFFNESWEFPVSGGDTASYYQKRSIARIMKCLQPIIDEDRNVIIGRKCRQKIFIKDLISFCKLEGIDPNAVLNFESRIFFEDKDQIRIRIKVNYGLPENAHLLEI